MNAGRAPFLQRFGIKSGAALGLMAAALCLTLIWAQPLWAATPNGQDREINLTLRQWGYEPGIIEVNQGDRVTLHLHAVDVTHAFYLDAYNLQQVVNPEEDKTVTFVASKAGRWMFRCSYTCGSFHPYMTGWLRVAPNRFAMGGSALAMAAGVGFLTFLGWEAIRK